MIQANAHARILAKRCSLVDWMDLCLVNRAVTIHKASAIMGKPSLRRWEQCSASYPVQGAHVEGKQLDQFRTAYHGETEGTLEDGRFGNSEVYLSHDRQVAETYAEEGGTVYLVKYLGSNPLLLDAPEKFVEAWNSSGADQVAGNFHPHQTGTFAGWAREMGYDAIVIPQSAFEGGLGYEKVAGTVGEPQIIVLYPHLALIVGNCTDPSG